MTFTEEARNFYHEVIKSSTGFIDPSPRGTMWSNINDLKSIIETSQSDGETIKRIQDTYRYSINPTDPRIVRKMVDWYVELLGGLRDVEESNMVINSVIKDGLTLSPDFLRTVCIAKLIRNKCEFKTSPIKIMELGGGSGHLARTLKLMLPQSTYIGIDIPETLFFAYVFLRLNFPDAKALFITKMGQVTKTNLYAYDFVFVPTLYSGELEKQRVDLFCNTASMGEMNNHAIRYWMDFIQNSICPRYFYGLNRFLNPFSIGGMLAHDRLHENEANVLFDAKWNILQWEVEPPHSRCPYEEPSTVTRNLEILAERLSSPQRLGPEVLDDLKDCDWHRLKGQYIHAALRFNVLRNDLTMDGTLFKLWDYIRLTKSPEAARLMLEYLETIQRDSFPFEEYFYYSKLEGSQLSPFKSLDKQLQFTFLQNIPMLVRYKIYELLIPKRK